MFGPHFGRRRRRRLIAVRMRVDAGRGIVAEVAMNVDDAGGQIFSGAVIDRDVGRDRRLGAADGLDLAIRQQHGRSEEHTSELQSLMRISYAVFCLKKKKNKTEETTRKQQSN